MKSIALILASAFCVGSPAMAQPEDSKSTSVVQSSVNQFLFGKDIVQSVRADYTDGKYNDFLKNMDHAYQNTKKSNDLEGLIELRKETAQVKIHPEFAKAYRIIQESRNKDLLKAASNYENTPFTKKVQSAAQSIADIDDHLQALTYKVPGTGANGDENTIIDLGLEYTYKAIHLDSLAANSSMKDRKEKHMALEMEKMSRMVEASKSFSDKKLKSSIEDAAVILDARIAKSYDMGDLLALGKGKIKPTSTLEEKAATIVSNSQGDLSELHRHLLNSIDNEVK